MVQRYLPEVRKGDKRIILVDGEAAGAINRVPADGEIALQHACRRPRPKRPSSPRATARSAPRIGPELKTRGLIFVGIDVIGDYLTEINVTSPTGISADGPFGGPDIAAAIVDAIEHLPRMPPAAVLHFSRGTHPAVGDGRQRPRPRRAM